MTEANELDLVTGKLDCLRTDFPARDYSKLGAQARRLAETRRSRRKEMGILSLAMIVALGLFCLAPYGQREPLAVNNSDTEALAISDSMETNKGVSADDEIAMLFAELHKSRARQRELEQSWEEYRQRERSLAAGRKTTIDQYLESVTSSNRTAMAMLLSEKAAATRRPVDASRLRAIIQLYPDTSAAVEASQLLANHN